MKKLANVVLIITIFFLVQVGCKSNGASDKKTVEVLDSSSTKDQSTSKNTGSNEPGIIKEGCLGDIKLGNLMSGISSKLDQKTRTTSLEGEEYTIFQYYKDGELLFEVEPTQQGDSISEMDIFSGKFKTEKGVGVGSTMREAVSLYKDYHLWYGEEAARYVLDFGELSSIQFLLDTKDYVGKEIMIEGDSEDLNLMDFKKDAKIQSVRIF